MRARSVHTFLPSVVMGLLCLRELTGSLGQQIWGFGSSKVTASPLPHGLGSFQFGELQFLLGMQASSREALSSGAEMMKR